MIIAIKTIPAKTRVIIVQIRFSSYEMVSAIAKAANAMQAITMRKAYMPPDCKFHAGKNK